MSDGKTGVRPTRDITELARVRAEQERIAEDLTRLIDTANAPIIGIDAEGRVNEWNQTAARTTGFSKEEVLGKDLVDEFITDDYKTPVREVLQKALAGVETSNYEFPLFTKSGDRLDVLLNSTTRRDASGQVVGVVGVGQDITELARVRAEQEQIAEDLTRLIDTANAPIIGIDAEGRVNEWNQTAARTTGFSKEEVLGKDLVDEFITDDYKTPVREVLQKALAGVETSNYEFPLFTKSGDQIHLLLNATSRRAKDQTILGVIGIGQDITGRLEQEAQLRQRVKLEAIGGLTGGVAHDFNNLLTVISGNLSMLAPRDAVEREIVEDALNAARDGSELVRNLLAFSRRQRLMPRSYDAKKIITEFQRSLARTLGESVEIGVEVDAKVGAAFVDRTQFEAALLNLCLNARDAILHSGSIRIEGERVLLVPDQESEFGLEGAAGQDFVCIRVVDDGEGIPSDLLPKVLEPFFTTKEAGEGSGLGLSSVAGFVEQSGGGMRIQSELGVGTRVELLLPNGDDTEVVNRGANDEFGEPRVQAVPQATILVVDDEPRVRKVAVRWLNREGYEVLEADSGNAALACIEQRQGRIDVLFSDIVMPGGMDGWGLAREVSARYPRVGIQLATGYDHARRANATASGRDSFPVLVKPYSLHELSTAIRDLLPSRRPRDPDSPGRYAPSE